LIKFPSLIAGSTTPQFGRSRKPCSREKNAIFIVIDHEDGTAGSSQTSPYIYETTCHYLAEGSHGHRREKVKSHKNNIYFLVFYTPRPCFTPSPHLWESGRKWKRRKL